jgi:hypothetical protein
MACASIAPVGALGRLVIHLAVNHDLTLTVIAEKQPVLLKEFGAKPVLIFAAQSQSLAILRAAGIVGNDNKCEFVNGGHGIGNSKGLFALVWQNRRQVVQATASGRFW